MTNPTKAQLAAAPPGSIDTESLAFDGLRGDPTRHLDREALLTRLDALPPAPTDGGVVDRLVARGPRGERALPPTAHLTVAGGMPGDRWVDDRPDRPGYQLATIRTDVAQVIANGQPLELHGDNLAARTARAEPEGGSGKANLGPSSTAE